MKTKNLNGNYNVVGLNITLEQVYENTEKFFNF